MPTHESRYPHKYEPLISKAAEIFGRSKTEEKRQLIGYVFLNLEPKGETLSYPLKRSFNLFVEVASCKEWLPFVESYRTLFIMPDQGMQHVFQAMKGQSIGFA